MIKVKDDIVFSKQPNGTTVVISLDDPDNSFYTISGIAAECFGALYNQKNIDDFKNEILKKYDVTANLLNTDVENLINDLKLNNIIE